MSTFSTLKSLYKKTVTFLQSIFTMHKFTFIHVLSFIYTHPTRPSHKCIFTSLSPLIDSIKKNKIFILCWTYCSTICPEEVSLLTIIHNACTMYCVMLVFTLIFVILINCKKNCSLKKPNICETPNIYHTCMR